MEQSQVRKRIEGDGAKRAAEQQSHGFIGYVENYHPATKWCTAECSEHTDDKELDAKERHTADIKVVRGHGVDMIRRVPCFVYSSGIIDKGLQRGDRVFVQYINGDKEHPVITGYYREPGKWEFAWNSLRVGVSNILDEVFGEWF